MCGKEFPIEKLKKCPYCNQLFCEDDYPKHMAWEHRHEGLAEDEAKLWRERREISE